MRLKSLKFALFTLLTLVALFALSSCGGNSKGKNHDLYTTGTLHITFPNTALELRNLEEETEPCKHGDYFKYITRESFIKSLSKIGYTPVGKLVFFDNDDTVTPAALVLRYKEPFKLDIDGSIVNRITAATLYEWDDDDMAVAVDSDIDVNDYISLDAATGIVTIVADESFILHLNVASTGNRKKAVFKLEYTRPLWD